MTKKLELLLEKLNKQIGKAYDTKKEIEGYLGDKYDIDTIYYSEYIEDNLNYVYGFNEERIEKLIKERKNNV